MTKRLTQPDDSAMVLQKIRNFCSFQERHTREVEDKLKDWAVQKKKIPTIIKQLQKENFLNEVRFAHAFAGGKFRQNKWGRVKIDYELSIRGIPEPLIRESLATIDAEDYMAMMQNLILAKKKEINTSKDLNVRDKILNFVSGKGYEISLVIEMMDNLKIG